MEILVHFLLLFFYFYLCKNRFRADIVHFPLLSLRRLRPLLNLLHRPLRLLPPPAAAALPPPAASDISPPPAASALSPPPEAAALSPSAALCLKSGFGIRAYKSVSTEKAREWEKLQDRVDAIHNSKKTNIIMTNTSMPPKSSHRKRKTIETCFDSYGRAELDKVAAKFFYSSCIPLNVARNPYWKKYITMLANGKLSGYIPPSSERLRTSLLETVKSEVEQSLERKKFKWNTTGVSIVSDGWTDIQRRPLINFIAIARNEPIFLKAVDASGQCKDAEYLKQLFIEVIKDVGPDKVVQLITDNAAICKSVGLSLRYDFPHIFWTSSVAHTLNLALKDICNPPSQDADPKGHELFSWIQEIEKDATNIKNFIVNHQHALSIFDSYSDLRLLKVAETRFASIIVMLKRIQTVRNALIQMVASREWWSFYRVEDEDKAQIIKNIIADDKWWDKIAYFLDFTEPIWCMLRAVDKDEPMLHKVYEMWDDMIKQIQCIVFKKERKDIALDNSEFFDRIHTILVERWDKSNTPLYCMAHSLNPKYYTKKWIEGAPGRVTPNLDSELSRNRISCMERLFSDSYTRRQAVCEYLKFSLGDFSFEDAAASREDDDFSPFDWWASYGSEMPVLQKLALRLLSQPATSSCCEKNWSIYGHMHNIKKNKFTNQRAEDLVYVHSNLRLLSRKEKEYSCGSSQYWDVNPDEFDFDGEHNLYTANMGLADPVIPSEEFDDDDDIVESIEENQDIGGTRTPL